MIYLALAFLSALLIALAVLIGRGLKYLTNKAIVHHTEAQIRRIKEQLEREGLDPETMANWEEWK